MTDATEMDKAAVQAAIREHVIRCRVERGYGEGRDADFADADATFLLTALDEARAEVAEVRYELGDALTTLQAAESVVAAARALVDAEVADAVESRVRSARADVRCLSCNLRYGERDQYGCHESGRAHTYDDGDLAAAEECERAEPVEYVTLPVEDLRAVLPAPTSPGRSKP